MVTLCAAPSAAVPPPVCAGDCDGNLHVVVNELVLGLLINLGREPVARCPAVDLDGSGTVAINEVIAAVNSLIGGCPGAPTPTATATLTSSSSPSASMTATLSASASATRTATITRTPSVTLTATASHSATATETMSSTPSESPTASPTSSPSLTPTPRMTPPLSARVCGNGTMEPGEECDDDNLTSGDGCSALCRSESHPDPCASVTPVAGTELGAVRVAGGLSNPIAVTAPPGDTTRIFIVEQTGRIRIVRNGEVLGTPFLDLRGRIVAGGERGLLGLAFHPFYDVNGQFFVDYTMVRDGNLLSVVSRYHVSANPDIADAGSEEILLEQPQPFVAHNGGQLAFDLAGFLYITFGDGGQSARQQNTAQDPTTWLGKVLRIDVDGGKPYAIPLDNPYVGADGVLDEIWTMGHRNPWRLSFDRATGDAYIGDVGEGSREEIDLVPAGDGGQNFGWCCREGTLPFPGCFQAGTTCPAVETLTSPLLEYPHEEGCSVSGGFVYRGCALPDLHGTYFYADYCSEFIRSFVNDGGVVTNQRDWTADLTPDPPLTIDRIPGFGEDARGEIYVCDIGGEVFKIVPKP